MSNCDQIPDSTPANVSDLLGVALAYAQSGLPVFPLHTPRPDGTCSCGQGTGCKSIGKHPRTRNGLKDATTDEAQVRAWWTTWPDANIGIACGSRSGIVVLDIDGPQGEESLRHMTDAHGALPATRTIKTGKGRQMYFQHPGGRVKSRAPISADYPGLDSRGDGGYVVAPPSLHANGNRYAGIYVESHGAINATSLQTNGNQTLGTGFTNNGALTPQTVSVTKSEFLGNSGNGLEILSVGKATLNNIRSNNNTSNGFYINTTGDLAVLSTLGENFFNFNGYAGFNVFNAENINMSKVTINDNGDEGIYVNSAATLSISSGSIFRNDEQGIDATLTGDAVLRNLMVVNNGIPGSNYDGIRLTTAPASIVSILGCSITGHVGSGIDLTGASDLILDGSFYYGNDTNNDGQSNVDWP